MPTPDLSQLSDADLQALRDRIAESQRQAGPLAQQIIGSPPPGAVEDIARTAVPAVVRGGAGLFGLPGALKGMLDRGMDATLGRYVVNPLYNVATGRGLRLNTAEEDQGQQAAMAPARALTQMASPQGIVGGVESVTGPLYHPQTMPGRLANSAIEWGTGGAMGPLRQLPTMIGIGAAGGAASQGTDEGLRAAGYPEDSWQRRFLPPIAGIGTSVGASLPFSMRSTPGQVVDRRLGDVANDPAALAAARTRMQAGADAGVPLSPVEGLGDAGGQMQQLAGNIVATPQGARLSAALNARQPQVTNAVRGPGGFLEGVSPDINPTIPMEARSAATSPLYRQAAMEPLDPAAVGAAGPSVPVRLGPIVRDAQQATAEAGANNQLGRQIGAYERALVTPEAGETTMRVGPLQTLAQNTRDRVLPTPEVMGDAERAALTARLGGALEEPNRRLVQTLEDINPTFREAQDRFRAMSPRVDAAAIRQRFDELYEQALQAGATRATNPTVGARFAQAVRGREGGNLGAAFEEDIRTAAAAQGRNPDAAVQAANGLMDALAQTGRVPGVGSQTAPRGALSGEARRSILATILELPRDIVGRGPIASALRNRGERSTYSRLQEALMPGGPEQLDRLLELARQGAAAPARGSAITARRLQMLEAPSRSQERR